MGISIFEKILDSLHLSFLYKGGDKKTTNQAAGRDIINLMMVMNKGAEGNKDFIVEKAQKLIANNNYTSVVSLKVVLGTYLGIVKSAEKPGTRVHLDFAVMNLTNRPTVLQGTYIKIDDGIVHLKKFYKSNYNGSREPDMSQSFPIIINSQGAAKLQIEYENIGQILIHKGKIEGEVFVLAEGNSFSSRKFLLPVDDAMIETLRQSQESADNTGIPSIFLATIQSLE